MARSLLVLPLLLCSTVAFAAEPAPAEGDEPSCPRSEAEQRKSAAAETSAPADRPGTTAPVRARNGSSGSAGRGTPRWHSMLPGMVR